MLLLYVDDILLASNSKTKLSEVTARLGGEFEMTILGELRKFLGMEITWDRKAKKIFVHQTPIIEKLLRRFELENVKPTSTPMATKTMEKVNKNVCCDAILYRQAFGLLYLANGTRPNITFAVNLMSRKQSNCNQHDWLMVKRIFWYLNGVKELGLFNGCSDDLTGYSDVSLGTNDSEGKSTSGYAIYLFGDLVTWRTKK